MNSLERMVPASIAMLLLIFIGVTFWFICLKIEQGKKISKAEVEIELIADYLDSSLNERGEYSQPEVKQLDP